MAEESDADGHMCLVVENQAPARTPGAGVLTAAPKGRIHIGGSFTGRIKGLEIIIPRH